MEQRNHKEWKPKINEAIADVCLQIIKEPLTYFSEPDVQQLLVERLRKITSFAKYYPTNVLKGKDSKGRYQTTLIHREYGGGERTRIDIIILDPADVAKIDSVNLTNKGKYLKPAFAFELGTEKTPDVISHLKNDIGKLCDRVKDSGYIIHIYRDVTQSRTGTLSREKTEEKIKNQFKNVVEEVHGQNIPNIKILAILLRTYRDQKKMRGKCKIFNGQDWVPVNINNPNDIKNKILEQLI
jgi:hypothetical protein